MDKKYAYLIIAHDNFKVLEYLIKSLDDSQNDIYLHIDAKVKSFPIFNVNKSDLIILNDPLDVKWGEFSQIKCEYLLFETAVKSNNKYLRYNLISGTHFPLKSKFEIDEFFLKAGNVQLLSYMYTNEYEVNFKTGYYHFFVSKFHCKPKVFQLIYRFAWQFLLKLQKVLGLKRRLLPIRFKANNWVSLTSEAVLFVLSQKEHIYKRFKYTLCGDEFFIPYLLDGNQRFIIKNEPLLLYNDFGKTSNPRFLDSRDLEFLKNSDYIFARKVSDSSIIYLDNYS